MMMTMMMNKPELTTMSSSQAAGGINHKPG